MPGAQTPFSPKRQADKAHHRRAQERCEVSVEWKVNHAATSVADVRALSNPALQSLIAVLSMAGGARLVELLESCFHRIRIGQALERSA